MFGEGLANLLLGLGFVGLAIYALVLMFSR